MDSYADIYSARHNVSEGPLFLVGGYKAVLIPKEGMHMGTDERRT